MGKKTATLMIANLLIKAKKYSRDAHTILSILKAPIVVASDSVKVKVGPRGDHFNDGVRHIGPQWTEKSKLL